jgi:TrmH family RNA methyltransferase
MPASERHRLRRVASRQNALVKELRRAFHSGERTAGGECAIESVRILEEAVRSGARFRAVFFRESDIARADRLLPQLSSHAEALLLPDEVFDAAVATESPQGVAALVKFKQHSLDDALRPPAPGAAPLVVVCAGLQDPGNLGAILRSAEAFAAGGLLLGEKTVSPFNPKAVRASAGSLFRLPVVQVKLAEALPLLRARGLRLLATSSHKGTPLHAADLRGPLAFFIGNEGAGLPREVLSALKEDEVIAIPHAPRVESLNAAIAASIVLYEAARQRRQ